MQHLAADAEETLTQDCDFSLLTFLMKRYEALKWWWGWSPFLTVLRSSSPRKVKIRRRNPLCSHLSIPPLSSWELPQCGARSETARLYFFFFPPWKAVALATGRHVIVVAVEGRAGGRGSGARIFERGVLESRGALLTAYQEPAAESCGLKAPCQIRPEQADTHCACTCVCVCMHVPVRVCSPHQKSAEPITEIDCGICLCLLGRLAFTWRHLLIS